jgi:hypothetical protein
MIRENQASFVVISEVEGWKDLTDDEIMDVKSAVAKLTDYAGPADYAFNVPLPKFEIASNAESYAEMNPIIFMKIESMLKRLEGREGKALERFYEQMIAQARRVLGSTNQGGQTP